MEINEVYVKSEFDEALVDSTHCGEIYRHPSGQLLYRCLICARTLEQSDSNLQEHISIHFYVTFNTSSPSNKEEIGKAENIVALWDGPKVEPIDPHNRANADEFVLPEEQIDPILTVDDNQRPKKTRKRKRRSTSNFEMDVKTKEFQCKLCLKQFTHIGYLRQHSRIHEENKSSDCNQLRAQEKQRKIMEQNLILSLEEEDGAEKVKKFQCAICHKTFTHRGYLRQHFIGHQRMLIKAEGSIFETESSMKLDTSSIDHSLDEKPVNIKCEICHQLFPHGGFLRQHLPVHGGPSSVNDQQRITDGDTIVKMEMDDGRTVSLPSHEAIGLNIKSESQKDLLNDPLPKKRRRRRKRKINPEDEEFLYNCKVCQKEFHRRGQLWKHLRSMKNCNLLAGDINEKFKCDICRRIFKYKHYLVIHIEKHIEEIAKYDALGLPVPVRQYPCQMQPERSNYVMCDVCGEQVYRSNMTNHINRHLNRRPHQCPDCGKSYLTLAYLRIHRRYHSGERPYKCTICPKAFAATFQLTLHTRMHMGTSKNLKCEQCDYVCRFPANMRIHVRTQHTGERPFACDQCDSVFANVKVMRVHRQTHSNVKKYKCRYCDAHFTQGAGRRCHERRIHEKE